MATPHLLDRPRGVAAVGPVPIDGYELWERPGYLLRRSHRLHGALWAAHAPGGLTSPQYGVLAAVEREPGLDQRTLGERLSLDRASVAGIVRRLVASGLILRDRDPADARRNRLTLSDTAAHQLPEFRAAVQRVWDDVFSPVPADQRQRFAAQLARMVGTSVEDHDSGALFRRLEQKRSAAWSEVVGDVFTGPQFALMHVIGQQPGLSQKDLGEVAALDKSTVAEILDRLAARGWIRRDVAVADGRVRRLSLTPSIISAIDALVPRLDQLQLRLLDPIAPSEIPGVVRNWSLVAYRGEPPTRRATT